MGFFNGRSDEEELIALKAELEYLEPIVDGSLKAGETSSYWIDKIIRLKSNIAVLEFKLGKHD